MYRVAADSESASSLRSFPHSLVVDFFYIGSVELMEDGANNSVYSFKTPKRANQMAKFGKYSSKLFLNIFQ